MKIVLGIVGGIVIVALLVVLVFALEVGGLKWNRYFAPKREAIRREVFRETRSYNESKLQDLARYKLQYERTADATEKAALAGTIRHMFADYEAERLPEGLATFLKSIRSY